MAVLWPRYLSSDIKMSSFRSAEVKVYEKLGEILDDSFSVFYSTPWVGLDEYGRERDGECDFVVIHPDFGMLTIEVKGGEVSYRPDKGQWASKDRYGVSHIIKDPISQAKKSKYQILQRVKKSPKWPGHFIHAADGVVLPDASVDTKTLGINCSKNTFCDTRRFRNNFREWISERLCENRIPKGCKPLGEGGVAALQDILAGPLMMRFLLSASLAESDEAFKILEPIQFQILDMIKRVPRALITGAAGTGKTVIAMEEAVRSAENGKRTLLTCYSQPLAINIGKKLKNYENLTVSGFHSLCIDMASQAGISIRGSNKDHDYYDSKLPNALFNSMGKKCSLKWDTVVVDEGQDFHSDCWLAIDACVKKNGTLRVFMDNNQKIYDKPESGVLDIAAIPLTLSRNLRNTKNIHQASMIHYSGDPVVADGPDGREVEWREMKTENKVSGTLDLIRWMVQDQEVSLGEIAVICDDTKVLHKFLNEARGTTIPFTDAEVMALDEVTVDTVERFKGLERPVVVYITGDSGNLRRELAYVAFSRARSYLCIVYTDHQKRWLSGDGEIEDD